MGAHPGLVKAPEHGLAVHGELWDVDSRTLSRLDRYEGVPHWFIRQAIMVANWDGRAQAYFYCGDATSGNDCGDRW